MVAKTVTFRLSTNSQQCDAHSVSGKKRHRTGLWLTLGKRFRDSPQYKAVINLREDKGFAHEKIGVLEWIAALLLTVSIFELVRLRF